MKLVRAISLLLCLAAPLSAFGFALDHLRTTDDIGINKIPHLGTSHILVIPSRVGPDAVGYNATDVRAYYKTEGGPGTFRDYWKTVSNGRWDPIPTVVDPVLYTDRCPIPGRTMDNCTITLMDIGLISDFSVRAAFRDILERVRDEQQVDFAEFDVNTATGPGKDGFFDGVVVDTDIYSGIAFPLAVFDNEVTLPARTDGGPMMTVGIVALVPPFNHEMGHALGFIDSYGGPYLNCLMNDIDATLSAFSRQQIGWGEVRAVEGNLDIALKPVLDGGPILRFGVGNQYILVENRGGAHHAALESTPPGINIYTIDEDKLPDSGIGFIDLAAGDLYLPNAEPPYLNVNLPVSCNSKSTGPGGCVTSQEGDRREILLPTPQVGFSFVVGKTASDGTIELKITGGKGGEGSGCSSEPGRPVASAGLSLAMLCLALFVARARLRVGVRALRGRFVVKAR